MRRMRKGFTIVELLIVVAILAVLATIVMTAASGSIRKARAKRADTMCVALQQAVAAYYAQEGKWPDVIEARAKSMSEDTYAFSYSEADQIFQQVVGKGFGRGGTKSMLIDATGLFVADSSKVGNSGKGCYDNHGNRKKRATFCGGKGCANGIDFALATARNGKHKIGFSKMAFGYQGPEEGKFCRYWITYNARTDSVTVSRRGPDLN